MPGCASSEVWNCFKYLNVVKQGEKWISSQVPRSWVAFHKDKTLDTASGWVQGAFWKLPNTDKTAPSDHEHPVSGDT